MSLMSMRQYAKHRGVVVSAVSKAVKTGRISTVKDEKGERKINPEVADREWTANSDPMKTPRPAQPAPEPAREAPTPSAPNVNQSTAILKAYQARLAKLEYEERMGKLVDAAEVKNQAFELARSVRESIMSIPARVSAELAAEPNRFKVHQRLETELRLALEAVSKQLEEEA